ncbi:hypothetical protein LCGC14_1626210 [marine sediment metagenome]|uniref:Uncharacterized protein n=1 Tax=marine sediment metagenome TaxID=412755 RepID=A0A0F9KJK7_9ZZZZ
MNVGTRRVILPSGEEALEYEYVVEEIANVGSDPRRYYLYDIPERARNLWGRIEGLTYLN